MTKIIPLNTGAPDGRNKLLEDDQLVKAAWHLAYASLWNHRHVSEKETTRAQHFIRQYLMADTSNCEKAFPAFCERILLAHGQLTRSRRQLPMPSVWLHPNNTAGFTATLKSYQQVEAIRQHISGYQAGIQLLARYYRRSISNPATSAFGQCRRRLVQLREDALWSLFCQALCYLHFRNPVKP